MPSKKRVVITGAAGFIGSHLSETLLDRGYEVVGIDNLLTGDTANIAHLANRDFTFIKHDVTNYIYVEGPVHAVLHWASPASPIDYLELPIPTLKVGALGTHKALGLAKAKNARFVLASTSEVYGDPLEHPQKETYWGNVNPIGPRGVYDEAKRFAEAMTTAYRRYHDVDAKIVRIFNTYGPRMRVRDGRAVPAFMSQALRNEDVTIFGSGSQTRSFCYVTDLVDGILRLMESDVHDPVNIGNPHEMTIEEIARAIIDISGPRMRVRDGRAVPAFMSQALRNEDVTIFGSGSQTRSFCYVTDLVDGILRLMESDVHDPVNIGNPHEMTIEEIARAIIDIS